jgi:hypothetical protein
MLNVKDFDESAAHSHFEAGLEKCSRVWESCDNCC